MRSNLKKTLEFDEGRKNCPYKDTLGNWTIGVGHYIGKDLEKFKLSEKIIDAILREDVKIARKEMRAIFGANKVKNWLPARRVAVLSMIFNLGGAKFREFNTTIAHIRASRWKDAGKNILKTLWAKQVKSRADRISYMLITGKYHPNYKIEE